MLLFLWVVITDRVDCTLVRMRQLHLPNVYNVDTDLAITIIFMASAVQIVDMIMHALI